MNNKYELDRGLRDVMKLLDKNKPAPDDDAAALMALLQGKKTSNLAVTDAFDISEKVYKKEALESLILAGCSADEIRALTDIPTDVTEKYSRFFFNTNAFRDRLDRIEYGMTYAGSAWGKKLKKLAVERGKEAVKIQLIGIQHQIDGGSALHNIRTMSFVMAQEALANPIDSNISKEARGWAALCLKSTEEKSKTGTTTIEGMKLELDYDTETTTNEDKSGISADSIHK